MTALKELYNSDHSAIAVMVAKLCGLGNAQWMNPCRLRREVIAQRLRLYRDDGRVDFERVIDTVFESDSVKAQRKKMIDVASEQNVTRRITDEVASLYDQPAVRTLPNKAANEQFREVATAIELDEVMQEAHRLTFLCNEVLLWSVASTEPGAPSDINIVTPDMFDVIPHPRNKLKAAAFLVDCAPAYTPEGSDKGRVPHYELWDDEFQYLLNGNGELIRVVPHELGRIPGVLLHRRKPVDRLLDARAGRDITAGHLGVGLLEIMIMRLAKSQGERQPVLSGNLANIAAGQSMDGEKPLLLPPEVVAMMLDTKTTPEHYLDAKKDKLASVGQTYGLSYEQFTNTDGSSGVVYLARRAKLTELRGEARRRARVNERLVVWLMGFDPVGLRVDHQEQALPQDAKEKLELLKVKLPLGLDSPIAYLMREDPDLSRDEALAKIAANLRDYAWLVVAARALNMPAKADADNPGKSPQENGADGGKARGGDDAANAEDDAGDDDDDADES